MTDSPRLVLIGGGHAMLPSLARARKWTDAGVEVTLVDPQRWLYYSGMMPEYLGGVYEVDDIRIDLRRWARKGGVAHVESAATAIDPDARVVSTADGAVHPFDLLAVDVGGVNPAVPEGAVGTKPISRIRALASRLERVLADPAATLNLAVVGGGAAGTEIALNVTGRFVGAGRRSDLDLTIIEQDEQILPGFPDGMKQHATRLLHDRGAAIRTGTVVKSVVSVDEGAVRVETMSDRGETAMLHADVVLWATGSVGPSLLREGGLSTDDHGFLRVDRTLRASGHPRIFAAGDCATIRGLDLDKVGVHAVKQGPLLRRNLDRSLQAVAGRGTSPPGGDLKSFRPYPVAPLLLSTGTRQALWTAGPLWAAHPWLLRLKHWIDRRWIRDYAPDQWGQTGWRSLLGAESASSLGGGEGNAA